MSYRWKIVVWASVVGVALALLDWQSNHSVVDAYVPNLIAALVEAGVIVVLVDLLRERHDRNREAPIREVAARTAVIAANTAFNALRIPVPTFGGVGVPPADEVWLAWEAFDLVAASNHPAAELQLDQLHLGLAGTREAADRCVQMYGAHLHASIVAALGRVGNASIIGEVARLHQIRLGIDRQWPLWLGTVTSEVTCREYVESVQALWSAVFPDAT